MSREPSFLLSKIIVIFAVIAFGLVLLECVCYKTLEGVLKQDRSKAPVYQSADRFTSLIYSSLI